MKKIYLSLITLTSVVQTVFCGDAALLRAKLKKDEEELISLKAQTPDLEGNLSRLKTELSNIQSKTELSAIQSKIDTFSLLQSNIDTLYAKITLLTDEVRKKYLSALDEQESKYQKIVSELDQFKTQSFSITNFLHVAQKVHNLLSRIKANHTQLYDQNLMDLVDDLQKISFFPNNQNPINLSKLGQMQKQLESILEKTQWAKNL